jgi:hypothetical protein
MIRVLYPLIVTALSLTMVAAARAHATPAPSRSPALTDEIRQAFQACMNGNGDAPNPSAVPPEVPMPTPTEAPAPAPAPVDETTPVAPAPVVEPASAPDPAPAANPTFAPPINIDAWLTSHGTEVIVHWGGCGGDQGDYFPFVDSTFVTRLLDVGFTTLRCQNIPHPRLSSRWDLAEGYQINNRGRRIH